MNSDASRPTFSSRARRAWLVAAIGVLPCCSKMLGIGDVRPWDGGANPTENPPEASTGDATTAADSAGDATSTADSAGQGPDADAVADRPVDAADEVVAEASLDGSLLDQGGPPPPPTPQVLAYAQNQPWDLVVHGDRVFWTNWWAPGQVMSVPVDGGTPTVLANDLAPFLLAVDSSNVYFTHYESAGELLRVPLDGGQSQILASGEYADGIAVDSTAIYWGQNGPAGALLRQPLDGATPTLISQSQPGALAIDDAGVYWTTATNILSAPLTGGTVSTLGTGSPFWVVVSAGQVFWDESLPLGNIRRVGVDGGSPAIIASALNYPSVLAVDESYVYWTDPGTGAGTGSVMKARWDGGGAVAIATGQNGPHAVAVDDAAVYWTNIGDDRIMKVAKVP